MFLDHSDNMYCFECGKVYAFDIVRISGTFEHLFEKYVEQSKEYKEVIKSRKDSVYYNEFKRIVKKFRNEKKLNDNQVFEDMYSNFTRFGTFQQKL